MSVTCSASQVKRTRTAATAAAEAEKAEAEVDTTGLTTMQAWAARRAAKRAGEKKKARVAPKAAATPAPRRRTAARVRTARDQSCLPMRACAPGDPAKTECRRVQVLRLRQDGFADPS